MKIFLFITFVFLSFNLPAKQIGEVTKLPIPRFVSLKSDEANLRVGPSKNYPILIKYVKNNIPLEIIDEYDVWRQVKDYNKNIGWIHESLIKGDRYALVISKNLSKYNIFNRPNGKVIGHIGKNNVVELKKCVKNWCLVELQVLKGWILRSNIWGTYEEEFLNIGFTHKLIDFYWMICDNKYVNYLVNFFKNIYFEIFSKIKTN